MCKSEKFIEENTRTCSNELIAVESRAGKEVISYYPWITPDQARKAVEIEREEIIKKVERWLKEIHRVCDITDENGYIIDWRELQARFEKYLKE